jgi:alpha-tubulin suppressor-like RCC1 family protein
MRHPLLHLLMTVGLAVTVRLTVSLQAATQVVAWGNFGWTNVPPSLTNMVAIAVSDSKNTALTSDGTVTYWEVGVDGLSPTPPGLTNVVAISGGEYHTVALRGDGSVLVWGNYGVDGAPGGYERPVDPFIPHDLTNIVAVAAGESYSLALKADGTVRDWGVDNGLDRIGVPPGLSNVIAVAASFACCFQLRAALEFDGTLVAWRDSSNLVSIQTGLTNAVALAAGYSSLAVLQSDGKELFFAIDGDSTTVTSDGVDSNVVVIASSGDLGIFSLKSDGTISVTGGLDPRVVTYSNLQAVSAAWDHGLGLLVDGQPLALKAADRTVAEGEVIVLQATAVGSPPLSYRWQFNGAAIAGATNMTLRIPAARLGQIGSYSVMISNHFGAVIAGPTTVTVVPLLITKEPQSKAVFRGATTRLDVAAAGTGPLAYQWQFNGKNIAQGTRSSLLLTNVQPTDAGAYSVTVRNPAAVLQSATAILDIGQVAAWGNYYSRGSLPFGLTNILAVATASDGSSVALESDGTIVTWGGSAGLAETGFIRDLSDVIAIATSGPGSFFLALRADGMVANWTFDGPLFVSGLSNVVAIAGGGENLALRQDGTVAAWLMGWNGTNEVIMAATNQYIPPQGLAGVVAVAAGGAHSLALRRDGTVIAWGENSAGQTNVPLDLTNAVGIAAGYDFSLALRADGSIVAWGGGGAVPQGVTNAVRIAASDRIALALKSNGTIIAWGDNYGGKTKVPPELANVADVAIGWDHGLALLGDGPQVQHAAIDSAQLRNGRFECVIATESGRVYRLEFKDSVSETQWTPLNLVAGTGRLVTLSDAGATTSSRYYRIRRW